MSEDREYRVGGMNLSAEKVIDWILRIAIVLIGLLLSRAAGTIDDVSYRLQGIETRVTVIERSGATQSDLFNLESRRRAEVDDVLREIKQCLNRMQRNQQCDL